MFQPLLPRLLLTLVTSLALFLPAAVQADLSNESCLDCHNDPGWVEQINGKDVLLHVDPEAYENSIHGLWDCIDCHVDIEEVPHAENLARAACSDCHGEVAEEYATSIHGAMNAMGNEDTATCGDCHGSHYITPVADPDSPVFKMNLAETCATCHSNEGLTDEYRMRYPDASGHFNESIHGKALMQQGLIVAPSCNDCHGVHNIKPAINPDSMVHHTRIDDTCGQCHVGVAEVYAQSVHGQHLDDEGKVVAVCNDCHTAHDIEVPSSAHFKAGSDQTCGACHQEQLHNYHETYHGKAMVLGRANDATEVAACYDCHGHHDIRPDGDPESRLSEENIVGTCATCHEGATASFAGYIPHADHTDKENHPALYYAFVFMTTLLISVFIFFGLHTFLWLFRSLYLYLNDSKTFHETKVHVQKGDEWFTRFVPLERFLHFLVVTSFLLLVITGMPLKFYYTDWAKALFDIMGGVDVARALHHFGAIITFLYFGIHLFDRFVAFFRGRKKARDPETGKFSWKRIMEIAFGPDSMIPSKRDWDDFVAHQKWFFGKGEKPQFDRWTYWEKFDYLSVFWGVAIIGVSGLILWFPIFFTQFFPGWIINVALIVHSDEALLAAGFIFTFHFFNTHFRLEKLPMDTVIFSGRISKAEMLHERKRWYDRLVAEGRLDDHRVKDEWESWKKIAKAFGYGFFGLGLILLGMIVYAMAVRLMH
ncbi:MAG TPA: cytochrome c3 family protein [Oceanipulchritudo sp.]|nr:cytochrome c3 family protein [Oceanipulchritudo sp.]